MKFSITSASLLLLQLSVLFDSSLASMPRRKLSPIIWTVQNEMFKVNSGAVNSIVHMPREKAVVDVQIGDFLNIICPMYDFNDNSYKNVEYQTLYMVSKSEYETCQIKATSKPVREILRCDKPFENIKYTFYISKFSPVPGAIEFIPGNDYYFISTSNGTLNGLNNTEGGSCRKNNMKMIIRVLARIKSTVRLDKSIDHRYQEPQLRQYHMTSSTVSTTTSTKTSTTSNRSPSVSSQALKSIQPKMIKKITYVEVPYVIAETSTPVNDIFILEPDDYSDIISQFISLNNSDYYNGRNTHSYLQLAPSSGSSMYISFGLLLVANLSVFNFFS